MKWASGSEKGERISALRRLFGAMRNGVRLLGKKWYMWVSALACLFLIVGSTTVVLCHRLLPGFSSTRLGSALPMREVNAFKREPVITEALRCGWAEGDGKNVSFWSSDGIVFTSDDWGSSWTRRGDASRPAGAFLSEIGRAHV